MDEPQDQDFAAAVAELRERRRERALELRSEGLSARDIAAKLGVSHPTVLADLSGEQAEQTPDEWIRQLAGRADQTEPQDVDEWIRSRSTARQRGRARAQQMLDTYEAGGHQ